MRRKRAVNSDNDSLKGVGALLRKRREHIRHIYKEKRHLIAYPCRKYQHR